MDEWTGHFRPDLAPYVTLYYVQGESIYFGPENWCTVSHPLDHSPIPRCVIGNLTTVGWTLVYKSRDYLARSPFAEHSPAFEMLMMKQTMNDMADVAVGIAPMGMALVPAESIIDTLTNSIMRILLMLQTATSTSRPHCLCCEDPPVPAPRVCDFSFKSVVWQISNGVPNAEVSILPPMREFDPPALCRIHQELFRSRLYRIVTADPEFTPHVGYCEETHH